MANPEHLTPSWAVELASDNPVACFAAQELRRTLARIGAPLLPVARVAPGSRIALAHGPGGDGFLRMPDPAGLTLRGDGPRGLLYAVYDLLEDLGCRWVAPGPAGERLPRHDRVVLPRAAVARRPALPGRCLVIGHDLFLAEAEDWIVWAARNRLNTVFIHTIDQRLALGACRLRSWRRRRPALLPLLRERGMTLELGGHGMANLLPRRLFRSAPAMFRHNGERHMPDYNFCPSCPETLELLRRNAAAFFRAYPEADVYHLWPDDLLGGGWCRCPRCAGLSPSDQALAATNVLAETLEAIRPAARIAYLAYHDTEAPPAQVRPHPGVVLLYAPRSRSYAHAIAAGRSAINRPCWERLAGNLALFNDGGQRTVDGDTVTVHRPPSAASVFEYYLDGILFKSAPPPLPEVLRDDLRAYRDAGVHTVQALMTGDRPWLAAPLNAYLFARLAWEPEQDLDVLVATYAAARAPRAPAALAAAHCELAAAWRAALDLTPEEQDCRPGGSDERSRRPRGPLGFLLFPFDHGLDVLDYMGAARPARERRLEQLAAAEPLLARGRVAWAEVLAQAHADRPHLAAERAEWELAALLLRFLALRQQLYVLEGRGAPRATLRAALAEARAALDALHAWAAAHLPPGRARANHRLLRLAFQLHLEALADRRLALPWQRLVLRLRLTARLAWLVAWLTV